MGQAVGQAVPVYARCMWGMGALPCRVALFLVLLTRPPESPLVLQHQGSRGLFNSSAAVRRR